LREGASWQSYPIETKERLGENYKEVLAKAQQGGSVKTGPQQLWAS
jgi:hypothetical protein